MTATFCNERSVKSLVLYAADRARQLLEGPPVSDTLRSPNYVSKIALARTSTPHVADR